ncbi:hypothetical protein [Psychrobacter sp. I-STPA10]|uniref:hypothetical protein n=1 Tax=Psychrobacter sp. I-STPA10 TaxID=2585769 RepID=UPI001E5982EC|nr:hypothetical protein [Psychrobacter sp. I-STPA10]
MQLINYINSLHNINASGTNTLAESQINSAYFKDIYHPFPIVASLQTLIGANNNTIIILTGHAGDGKSTIAFELLRELGEGRYSQNYQFKKYEYLETHDLHVLKDMSELSLEDRKQWLDKAFGSTGNWVIVSNTGPLLTSIADALKDTNWSADFQEHEIESKILGYLDTDIAQDYDLSNLKLPSANGKDLYIVNIAKLDNIDIAIKIFKKIIGHSEWDKIIKSYPNDPITLNYLTIKHNYEQVEESIRLTYLYLLNYEKRMTLRQMLAHLSASITAGKNLSEVDNSLLGKAQPDRPLLFSDTFFGYIGDEIWHEAKDTKVMSLISKIHAGGYTSLEIENLIADKENFACVSEPLKGIIYSYIDKDNLSEFHKEKTLLRRILFIYGINTQGFESAKSLFLGSSSIHKFNKWQLDPSSFNAEKKHLKRACDKALNLFYSGSEDPKYINITLKRSDSSIFQIAQLMICSIPKSALRVDYDNQKKLPFLYLKSNKNIRLDLSLPLLDYIENIVSGDISESLNPIYKTQLERFKLSLIESEQDVDNEEITLVRIQANGDLKKSEIYFEKNDSDKMILKVEG